ncbi:hypothetical protein [Zavarzinia sp.]|uniref:hypothetical protein n=1 Tax=Zavarzinia sp. TaxID=2027920 RepID=UPI003BB764C2
MAIVLASLIALYSLISAAYPLRPFRTRSRAAICLVISIVFVGATSFLIERPPVRTNLADQASLAPADTAAKVTPGAEIPAPCGDGGAALMDIVAVTGSYEVRIEPSASAAKVKNEKASAALGEPHYHSVDNSTTVRRLCTQSEWTKVKIVTPEWLTHVEGWVPNRLLRTIEVSDGGARIYVEADFIWDSDTSRYKNEIVAVVNKIARDNRNCSKIDPSSVAKSPSKSKPGAPVFFVTCGEGADAFNVWFHPGDAATGTSFQAKAPIDQAAATLACEAAARAAATNPATVDFSVLWDLAYIPYASGRAQILSSFTAMNAFNLKQKFRIRCLFDATDLIETTITPSAR